MKYGLSDAAVKRIAEKLGKGTIPVHWQTAVTALREENVYSPERQLETLILKLSQNTSYLWLAANIGASAAYELSKLRASVTDFRRAYFAFMDPELTPARDSQREYVWAKADES